MLEITENFMNACCCKRLQNNLPASEWWDTAGGITSYQLVSGGILLGVLPATS